MATRDTSLAAVNTRPAPVRGAEARDFRRPQRMGRARLAALRVALENALPGLERALRQRAGLALALTLEGFGEVDADQALSQAGDPPCVLRFKGADGPAWLLWDSAAAAGVVEAILGTGGDSGPRRLSPTETRLAGELLAEVVRAVCALVGVACAEFALVQAPAELGTWREAGPGADAYRFEVRLALRQAERASTLRLFLSGVDPGAMEAAPTPLAELPGHLERVEVELSAELAGCELSLEELLALERGDVIPLQAHLDDLTLLRVEGLTVARARLGQHRGRLAVRIEQLDARAEVNA
jgi:flagellar motor switch protein FliM